MSYFLNLLCNSACINNYNKLCLRLPLLLLIPNQSLSSDWPRANELKWRSKGIIGIVCALKHMPPLKAVDQMNVVFDVVGGFSVEATGLLYDEMANAAEDLDREVTSELLAKVIPDVEGLGPVTFEIVESVNQIVIPMVECRGHRSYQIMCSQLRLCHRLLGPMDSIDDLSTLIGGGVILPNVDYAGFRDLPEERQKSVLDSHFYCINLFREVVNGFTRFRHHKATAMTRLEQVIDLTATAARLMALAPDYVPPQCQFYRVVKPPVLAKLKGKGKGKSKKKGKKGKKAEEKTSRSGTQEKDDDSDSEVAERPEEKAVDISLYNGFFRELDIHLAVMISSPLVINNTPSDEAVEAEKIGIRPAVLRFLLTDFRAKMEDMFLTKPNPFGREPVKSGVSTQIETVKAVQYCIKMVPLLRQQMIDTGDYCQKLVESCDGVRDALGMCVAGSEVIKECHTLAMQCLLALVSWPGFRSRQHRELQTLFLSKLAQTGRATGGTASNYVTEAFELCANEADRVLHLPGAVALLKLATAVHGFTPNPSRRKTQAVHEMCEGFLSCRWMDLRGQPETGASYNRHMEALLAVYTSTLPSNDRLTEVTTLLERVQADTLKLKDKDDCLASFVAISKPNYHVVFKAMCGALVEATRSARTLEDWSQLVGGLVSLTAMVKHLLTRHVLAPYAKMAASFLRVFLARGVPVLDSHFKTHTKKVHSTLRNVQTGTRFLQWMIHDAKTGKDTNLTAHVPTIRLYTEKLIFRVKAMCLACPDSFSSGNLRNRNMLGEEILSQETEPDVDEDGDEAGDDEEDEVVADSDDEREEEERDDDDDNNLDSLSPCI